MHSTYKFHKMCQNWLKNKEINDKLFISILRQAVYVYDIHPVKIAEIAKLPPKNIECLLSEGEKISSVHYYIKQNNGSVWCEEAIVKYLDSLIE